jgi:rhodanese-related sulfurtransferase
MTIEANALAAQIASGSAGAIVDVRSRAEFVKGHVPGAIHIPFLEIGRRLPEIAAPRDARLVVYCGHGPRARIAGAALRRHGFRHIVYLAGHMSRWTREGLPEERA